jgi:DNA-binding XRE family transcriptional regulator
MSTLENKIDSTRHLLLQIEAQHTQSVALARKALGEIEEEARELRREALKRDVQFFTEKQLAQRVGVSQKTIERMRKAGDLTPCISSPIRYSSAHVAHLARVPSPAEKPKRGAHLEDVSRPRKTG